MTTPGAEEPFAEAIGEAVQTSVMAVRLVMTIADAVRRVAEMRAKREKGPPPVDQAVPTAARELKGMLPPDIARAMMSGADWPQLAQQLVALQHAGVDMAMFLPKVGEMAATMRDAVAANAQRISREGTQEWAQLLRETMPAGPVREAVLSSPAWPDIAATMGRLQDRGVDVRQILVAAHAEGSGVDRAVARVLQAGAKPRTPSRDTVRSYGPLTVGLDVPKNLDLPNRETALVQLGVSTSENEGFVRMVREALPGREREASLLVNSRQWPLLAARMARMSDRNLPVADHLAQMAADPSWNQGPPAQLAARLVQSTTDALRLPAGKVSAPATPGVSTTAATARSTTRTLTARHAKGAAPAEPAVALHRAPAPAKGTRRTR